MLTDRQFVALQLFQNVISNWPEVFVTRTKDVEEDVKTIKRLADSALFYADIFLKQSEIESVEQGFKDIGEKLEEIDKLSQRISQNNKDLLDLVNSNIEKEIERELGTIAWIDGEPVYVGEDL